MITLPAAVLWDMDGTIIDTEPYWMAAETALVTDFGGTWSHEDALGLVGQGMHYTSAILRSRGVTLSDEEIVLHLSARVAAMVDETPPWRPGAVELLRELRSSGVPTALVTMSIATLAQQVIRQIGFDAFDVVVTGDTVSNSKPHPEPYLRAAELLGVAIADCVAIEDSGPGVQSAVSSGARTIAVPLYAHVPADSGATFWTSLAGRSVADLAALPAPAAQQ